MLGDNSAVQEKNAAPRVEKNNPAALARSAVFSAQIQTNESGHRPQNNHPAIGSAFLHTFRKTVTCPNPAHREISYRQNRRLVLLLLLLPSQDGWESG